MNKKLLMWLVIGLVVVGGVTAELVYRFNRTEASFTVVENGGSVLLNDNPWNLPTQAGTSNITLFGATNNLDTHVNTTLNLTLQEFNLTTGGWNNVTDDAGWYIAYSDSVKCCFGKCTSTSNMISPTEIKNCTAQYQQWMTQNPTWIYWNMTKDIGTDYNNPLIKRNLTRNPPYNPTYTYTGPMVDGTVSIPVDMPPGSYLGLLYVGTDPRLKGAKYNLIAEM